jgi:hypothetical protein
MFTAEPDATVRLNGGGLGPHRKLTQHGGQSIAYGDGHLTQAEQQARSSGSLTMAETPCFVVW